MKKGIIKKGHLSIDNSREGETLEEKLERILANGEPIGDDAPIIHTERNKGVEPQYNIRSDRWEIALDGIDRIQKSYQARREEKAKIDKKDGETEPIQGTEN